jgi:hypothetical protein
MGFPNAAQFVQSSLDAIPLTTSSGAKGTSGTNPIIDSTAHSITGDAVAFPRALAYSVFVLDVQAAAAAVGDTLDVWVQTRIGQINTGTDLWVDVLHFAQILGNGGVKRYFDKLVCNQPQTEFENAATLGVSSVRHETGDSYRLRYMIVDGGAHGQSFTFTVWGIVR